MHNKRCSFVFPGGSCHLDAEIRIAYTYSSNWAPPLRDVTDSHDFCTLHARVMSEHIESHMPTHWTRLTETLLFALTD